MAKSLWTDTQELSFVEQVDNTAYDNIRMDFYGGQLAILIRSKELTEQDKEAFQFGPLACSYLEAGSSVPVPLWSFLFRSPMGLIEVSINAQELLEKQVQQLLQEKQPNLLFLLFDDRQLSEVREFSPSREAWEMFCTTLQRQLSTTYNKNQFNAYVESMTFFTVEEVMAMGKRFVSYGWNDPVNINTHLSTIHTGLRRYN